MQRRRSALSITLLALQAAMAVVHLDPRLVYPSNPTTTAVVAYLGRSGPIWLVLFGLSALVLGVLLLKHRARHIAHLMCAAIWFFYDASLWWGAVATAGDGRAVGPIVLPLCALAVTAIHVVVANTYELEDGR